jgi:ubiquinone/menaquinone biosynthesis C-methylase UbiE
VLLIGDGNYKCLVDEAIAKNNLSTQVRCVGRVPQKEGARLLGACDLFVSPHNAHMIDSRFFGSPTKIFEYMAMAGGIVASDLEQIGQVLSPALWPRDLEREHCIITDQRAVLCTPGNVTEFVAAVVGLASRPHLWQRLGMNARQAVREHYSWERHVGNLWRFLRNEKAGVELVPDLQVRSPRPAQFEANTTGDDYKDEVQLQWNNNPCGAQYVKEAREHTLEWYQEAEAYRYSQYAPWMPKVMEFADHRGEEVLEIGGGLGTDLAQFALHGARVTDLDLSAGHLALARENFKLRGLEGRFVHHDAEQLPFADNSFDVVYSNGVIHHTPNTAQVVREIHRVLKPGGRAIIMVYAENSLHYWRQLFFALGVRQGLLERHSMGEIMSRHAEISHNGARPLVKVYTRRSLRKLFRCFTRIRILKRQLLVDELPPRLKWLPVGIAGRLMGWNLIIKATKGW